MKCSALLVCYLMDECKCHFCQAVIYTTLQRGPLGPFTTKGKLSQGVGRSEG